MRIIYTLADQLGECIYNDSLLRIDSHFLIKITDFGLSEDVFLRNYYREGVDGEMAKLPFKWMAPESLSDGHFSEKSDVVGQLFFLLTYVHVYTAIKIVKRLPTVVIWCDNVGDIQWR